ncbi:hypothetical protein K1T71_002668 [Dendrolimus kikuchii]|uniref:Uncharacterized protein n=1 Tax=Dendrolimus kikuchii TaxID=765133 RepID=A0ACC1DDM1_9NEOP|nr:hypothetical protein K1T71_002668 [Dendrolimus kikuchii]
MEEDTLRKIMRYNNGRDVWLELHRLFDGSDEDKAYNLCMSFFGYKKDASDDIARHMSKLKSICSQLTQELKRDNNKELPELLLICKILDTLDDTFISFRNSWLLLPKSDRTVESVTIHLCAFERTVHSSVNMQQEALISNSGNTTATEMKKGKKMKCNYCKLVGHRVKNCQKWIKDGKHPRNSNPQSAPSTSKAANILLMSIECTEVFFN